MPPGANPCGRWAPLRPEPRGCWAELCPRLGHVDQTRSLYWITRHRSRVGGLLRTCDQGLAAPSACVPQEQWFLLTNSVFVVSL